MINLTGKKIATAIDPNIKTTKTSTIPPPPPTTTTNEETKLKHDSQEQMKSNDKDKRNTT